MVLEAFAADLGSFDAHPLAGESHHGSLHLQNSRYQPYSKKTKNHHHNKQQVRTTSMRNIRAYRRPVVALWISSTSARAFTSRRLLLPTYRSASLTSRRQLNPFATSTSKSCNNNSSSSSISNNIRKMSSTVDDTTNNADIKDKSNLRVALCQFHVTEDKELNLETCASFLDQAAAQGANLVVLPEIWNSPYAVSAFGDYAEVLPEPQSTACPDSPSAEMVRMKALEHKLWIVGGSIPESVNDKLYNTCLVFDPAGIVVAKHRKVHLFDIDVPGGIRFLESETLNGGSAVTSFETPWCTIGVGICYDIRFPEYALLLAQKLGCQILVYPGAFNMTTGPAHWELLQRARAVDNQCYVLTASPARTEAPPADDEGSKTSKKKYPHYMAWGHSTATAPWGTIVATTDEKASVVVADLDLTKVAEMRRAIPTADQKRTDLYKLVEQV